MRPGEHVVVVGSGITGLVAAALLAVEGAQVTVLEAGDAPGGHAREIEVDGARYSAGPQYVWGFGPGEPGERVLAHLGLAGACPFDLMDIEAFERVGLADEPLVDVPMDLDRALARLAGPSVAPVDLERLAARIRGLAEGAAFVARTGLFLRSGLLMQARAAASPGVSVAAKWAALRLGHATAADLLAELPIEGRARSYANGAIFAEEANEVAAVVYAGATGLYLGGARYPRHGFGRVVAALAGVVTARGGQVRTGCRVTRLETTGAGVAAAHLDSGEVVGGGIFLSNIAPRAASALLDGGRLSARYEPSRSLCAVLLSVKGHPDLVQRLGRRNHWWTAGVGPHHFVGAAVDDPPASLFVGSPSANGEGNQNVDPERHSIVCFVPGDHARWAALPEGARAEARARLAERVVERVEQQVLPGLRGRARIDRVLSPLEFESEVGAEKGAVYGRRLTPASLFAPVPMRWPGLRNFWNGCATVGLPGIPQCFRTGDVLAGRVAGRGNNGIVGG